MFTIDNWIERRAELTPDRTALIDRSQNQAQTWSYKALQQSVNKMAWFLQEHLHVQKGDRVAILSDNRGEYLMAYLALAKLGAIAVPLNIRLTADEQAFQIRDSGCRALIFEKTFRQRKDELVFSTRIESVFELDSWQEIEPSIHLSKSLPDYHKSEHDPYIICYTSGTTGRPKGAVLSHANMYWNAINNILAIDIHSEDRSIVLLPLFHIGGIGLFAFPAFLAGGAVVVAGKFNPDRAIEIIEEEKVTIVMGVPAIHDAIRKSSHFSQTSFQSVRWFYNGGAPCPREVMNAYLSRGLPFGGGFGMTEASPTIFMLSKEDYIEKAGSIGKPVMFCDVKVMNEKGEEANVGEAGELWIKGPNVMKEYWKMPDATMDAFQDGWFKTGDLVRQDEDGFFWVAGRKKDMIISGGENIYPLEVEQVLESFEEVDEAVVIGTPDSKWGEVPVAFIRGKEGMTPERNTLISKCQQKIAKYKIPKRFYLVDDFPRNATGKIAKTQLKPDQFQGQELME
ncbi:MAG: o-succinylbenzoate--CoA ligase [Bacillaceae bacterium]|nr:o-succinylbenzoate--CoA ligase [Bacillaceae bacterium]